MSAETCSSVRATVAALLARPGATISGEVATHFAECALCRGALIVLVCKLADVPALMLSVCDTEALAAFLDVEGEAGTLAAIQEAPHAWWHLWLCEDCAAAYARFQTLREGIHNGSD